MEFEITRVDCIVFQNKLYRIIGKKKSSYGKAKVQAHRVRVLLGGQRSQKSFRFPFRVEGSYLKRRKSLFLMHFFRVDLIKAFAVKESNE